MPESGKGGMMRAMYVAAVMIMTACVPVATPSGAPAGPLSIPNPTIAADSAEYAKFLVPGTGIITGQAFLTTRGGDVKRAAGQRVFADPMTKYGQEWMKLRGLNSTYFGIPAIDPLFQQARRETVADADGRFRFDRLPPGNYLVQSKVTWYVGGDYGTQGGIVSQIVGVRFAGDSIGTILNQ